jgi:ATP-binding cassette subfamily B protein
VRSLIERQGGRFSIEPPGADHGMRYVIEMPLRAVDADATPPRSSASVATLGIARPLAGLRILSIDDSADARESLSLLLEIEGAQVLALASGEAALDWLEGHPPGDWPSLVLCDISLGAQDGYAVMRRIRHLEAERGVGLDQRVPAIALTGHAGAGDRVRALMAGFQVHLAKPVNPGELVSTIFALVGRRSSADSETPAT